MTAQPLFADKQLSLKISTDISRMQLDVIHNFLANSYWAKGISKKVVKNSLENSLCFGAFIGGEQVAFARVITDNATFAYLADVFVLESYQKNGIGKVLIKAVLEHPNLQDLRRILLCTADAHGLYKQFGFSEVKTPENMMAIHKPRLYLE